MEKLDGISLNADACGCKAQKGSGPGGGNQAETTPSN